MPAAANRGLGSFREGRNVVDGSAPPGRVSFDRAAEYYDRTRSLPPEAMEGAVAMLSSELAGRGRCLEVGVGTGRIALPLAEAGVPMAGVDVSEPMVRKLVEKVGGSPPFPLALGDATALPFRGAAFGAALLVHVLHLVPAWSDAVDELLRVVRPGGVLLMDLGSRGDPAVEDVKQRMAEAAGLDRRPHPGLRHEDTPQFERRLAARGVRMRELPPVPFEHRAPMEERIAHLQDGLYSWTWPLDPETRRGAAEAVRAWARQEYGDLEEPRPMTGEVRYRAYDLPAA